MGDYDDRDEQRLQRVISHMNKDHQDSISRYLQHYSKVSASLARHAKLVDITFDSMTIVANNTARYHIDIQPPMGSWSEVRARMVAMDQEALRGLGKSDITVKEYRRPRGFMAVVFVATATTFVCFSRRSNFVPGSFLYDTVLKYVPKFAQFCYNIQPPLIVLMVTIHASEAIHMERSRLEKHNLSRLSKLWWQWLLSTFIEGVGAFVRFDRIVKEEKERKEEKLVH